MPAFSGSALEIDGWQDGFDIFVRHGWLAWEGTDQRLVERSRDNALDATRAILRAIAPFSLGPLDWPHNTKQWLVGPLAPEFYRDRFRKATS